MLISRAIITFEKPLLTAVASNQSDDNFPAVMDVHLDSVPRREWGQ